MKLFALSLTLLVALSSFAADSKPVSYKSGEETINAVMYTPKGKGPFPALIVIHEWWGLNDWVKEQASALADEGYATLAVDLYRGKLATTRDEAHELSRGLPEDRASRDLRAAFDYLATQPNVDKSKIGSIGWCMGGGHSLKLAVSEPRLKAAVIKYGRLVTDAEDLKKINAAILGVFGAKDRGIPVEDVKKFEAQLKSMGKKVEIQIYPEAGHAFENPNNKEGYREADTKDSWTKTLAWLDQNLKK